MIKSFANKETETIFNGIRSKKLPPDIQRRALNKLRILDMVCDVKELKIPPGNKLEALKGSREGQYSIRINQQWRICFRWLDIDAFDVEITDYH